MGPTWNELRAAWTQASGKKVAPGPASEGATSLTSLNGGHRFLRTWDMGGSSYTQAMALLLDTAVSQDDEEAGEGKKKKVHHLWGRKVSTRDPSTWALKFSGSLNPLQVHTCWITQELAPEQLRTVTWGAFNMRTLTALGRNLRERGEAAFSTAQGEPSAPPGLGIL